MAREIRKILGDYDRKRGKLVQQCFMFLDWGDGWKSVNDHAEDVAALARLQHPVGHR